MPENKLEEAIKQIHKTYGKGSLMVMSDHSAADPTPSISTGCAAIDEITGIGGVPEGRIVEVYGPECVAEGTHIPYEIRVTGRRANHKGGDIERLYERFHKLPVFGDGRGKYQRQVTEDAEFFTASINDQKRVVMNKIENVVSSGKKECFLVKSALGFEITTTAEHRFLTPDGFVRLRDLVAGSTVYIHNNTPFTVKTHKDSSKDRVDLYVKFHPVAGDKKIRAVVNKKTGEKSVYVYKRLARARAVIEAAMNDFSLGEYVDKLNSGKIECLKFLPRDKHVHHRDENVSNDILYNLEVLSAEEHSRLHAKERHNNLRFMAVEDTITSITPVGIKNTYDIQMAEPYRNFVAQNFVVHNSGGKTTLALQIVANTQKGGGLAAYIDAENALDVTYARALGVNVDEMFISQPDNGEEALEIAEMLIRSGGIKVIVVDSVAALVPRAELEGDMGDPQMGLQARLMSQAMRKLNHVVKTTGTVLIFINQVRDKIGVMFGNPETTTGGRALKFYASMRLDIRRISQIKKGDSIIGQNVKVKCIKNKLSAPYRDVEVELIYGKGFSND